MEALQNIIQPSIGIFTNIGEAHDAYFTSKQQKLQEKLQLFSAARTVIGPYDQLSSADLKGKKITWGEKEGAAVKLVSIDKKKKVFFD